MMKLMKNVPTLLLGVVLAGVVIFASGCETFDQGSAPPAPQHHH